MVRGKCFLKKSRSLRKKYRQNLKNKIVQAYITKGRLFTTHHYVTPNGWWIDIWFLGKDKATHYSCALHTSRMEIQYEASRLASEEAEIIKPYDFELEGIEFGKKDPKTGYYTANFKSPEFEEFGGISRNDWLRKREEELESQVEVREHIKIAKNYLYGIGLHASLNAPRIDSDFINNFIINFIRNEEVEYLGTDLITLETVFAPPKMPKFENQKDEQQYLIDNDTCAIEPIPDDILEIYGLLKYKIK